MKRLKIWINGFNLIQQYFVVSFLAIFVFMLFIFQYLNFNIDTFTNEQMFSYLHKSQNSFLDASTVDFDYIDNNCTHYIYKFGSEVDNEIVHEILSNEKDGIISSKDNILEVGDQRFVYSIRNIGDAYLISIINDDYRREFKSSLISGISNSSIVIIVIVFMILMMWVYSLIHPLNQIRNYIKKVKDGEKATLVIKRNDEIGEVAEAIVDMTDELSAQERIREEMIQNISHDLKTPIATIKSYSESIKDGIYPYDTLEKSVDVIIEHADRLEKKVYQLIVLNKMGYLLDNCEPGLNLNMKNVIEKVIISLKVVKPEIELVTNLNDVYFHGEEEPWRIVVENLIDNALRYAVSYVKISLNDNELIVENDGKQIEEDRLDKLFKPYEKGTDGKFGLGLSIVQRVTSTYGYKVIDENLTNGVCFRIINNKAYYYKNDEQEVNDASIVQIEKKKKNKKEA